LIAQFVDPALRRYAPAGGGTNIVDDRHGSRSAGTERWLRDGFLRRSTAFAVELRCRGTGPARISRERDAFNGGR
jgi:hypothetical protein